MAVRELYVSAYTTCIVPHIIHHVLYYTCSLTVHLPKGTRPPSPTHCSALWPPIYVHPRLGNGPWSSVGLGSTIAAFPTALVASGVSYFFTLRRSKGFWYHNR